MFSIFEMYYSSNLKGNDTRVFPLCLFVFFTLYDIMHVVKLTKNVGVAKNSGLCCYIKIVM